MDVNRIKFVLDFGQSMSVDEVARVREVIEQALHGKRLRKVFMQLNPPPESTTPKSETHDKENRDR